MFPLTREVTGMGGAVSTVGSRNVSHRLPVLHPHPPHPPGSGARTDIKGTGCSVLSTFSISQPPVLLFAC